MSQRSRGTTNATGNHPQFSIIAAPVSIPAAPAKRGRKRRSNSARQWSRVLGFFLNRRKAPSRGRLQQVSAAGVATTTAPAKRRRRRRSNSAQQWSRILGLLYPLAPIAGMAAVVMQSGYALSLRPPLRMGWQWPVIITPRIVEEETRAAVQPETKLAQAGQFSHRLTAYQQYACNKFGSNCRVALAIQRAENPRGDCEIYHYNTDGTLDWGYFQINTVHLQRPGVNLRALLDCRANIDFAYQLYTERGFQPWTTYRNGAYRRFLRNF
jgi:hypothetical protein